MQELRQDVFYWPTIHEHIRSEVSSYYLKRPGGGVLIDPRVPSEGLDWFRRNGPPTDILLSNRHHFRHSADFQREFGATVWCHEDGLHEFSPNQDVRGFSFDDELPGGVRATEVAAICPDETALYIPWARAVSLADGVIRRAYDGPLSFVPDFLLGDDPEGVKKGLVAAFGRLLDLDFDTLLLAHGAPLVAEGRSALAAFVAAHE